jgi:hypothetical protein
VGAPTADKQKQPNVKPKTTRQGGAGALKQYAQLDRDDMHGIHTALVEISEQIHTSVRPMSVYAVHARIDRRNVIELNPLSILVLYRTRIWTYMGWDLS